MTSYLSQSLIHLIIAPQAWMLYSKVFTNPRKAPIITSVNQQLIMCVSVGRHVYKLGVNFMIQFSIKSDIFNLLCRRWFGAREKFYHICRINFVLLGEFGEYYRCITIIAIIMVFVDYIFFGWFINIITKIKLMGISLYEVTKGNMIEVDMGRSIAGYFIVNQNCGLGC